MARATTNNVPHDVGLLGHAFWLAIKLLFWSFMGWLIALSVATGLLAFMGKPSGLRYLHQLIHSQLDSLGTRPTIVVKMPTQTAKQVMRMVRHTLFVKTHIINGLNQWEHGELAQDKTMKAYLDFGYQWLGDYSKAWILTTQLIILRLVIAFFMLPLCILLGLVGFIDGLVQRDLRKFCGGRESALVYHRAKRYIMPTLMTGFFIYLILPLPLSPIWIFLPTAILFGLVIRITVSRFKKYV
jgi:integrating conjugative element membrane protein (TIGR03747 family)